MGKRITALLLTAMMLVTFGACGKKNEKGTKPEVTLQQVKDRKAYIVGFNDTYMPFGFKDANGTYRGFDLDLAKEFAKRLGVTLNLQTVAPETSISMLMNASIDYLGNSLAIPDENEKGIAFSDTIFKSRQVIVVMEDSGMKDKTSLEGKKVGVMANSASSAALSGDKTFESKITRVEFTDRNKVLEDLSAKKIDALVIEEAWAQNLIKDGKKLRILDGELKIDDYRLVFRKSDREMINRINELLKEMEKDGTLNTLTQTWFGKEYSEMK